MEVIPRKSVTLWRQIVVEDRSMDGRKNSCLSRHGLLRLPEQTRAFRFDNGSAGVGMGPFFCDKVRDGGGRWKGGWWIVNGVVCRQPAIMQLVEAFLAIFLIIWANVSHIHAVIYHNCGLRNRPARS